MTQNKTQQPISFFGKMLTFSRIKLATDDFELIKASLEQVSPQKDSLIPIVIDSDVEIDLKKLVDLLWDWGLQPIGVVKGKLDKQAHELRLALFPADGKRIQRVSTKTTANAEAKNKKECKEEKNKNKLKDESTKDSNSKNNLNNDNKPNDDKPNDDNQNNNNQVTADSKKDGEDKTSNEHVIEDTNDKESLKNDSATQGVFNSVAEVALELEPVTEKVTSRVYDQMLRSGQSINHVGGDLILTNSVNDGAEAITDNSLHIYGKGMGRLVAGATGDQEAHIFCQQFNPSLVSVAGTYMLRDSIPAEVIDKAVQVSYKAGEGLVFKVMDDWLKNAPNNAINAVNDR